MNKQRTLALEWAILFLFILPPLGIVWLIGIGICHGVNRMLRKQAFYLLHPPTFFFLAILLASIGACLRTGQMVYACIPVMVVGYLGMYLYIKDNRSAWRLKYFSRMLIIGGLYITIVGQFQLQKGYAYGGDWRLGVLAGLMPMGLEETGRLFGSAYNPNFAAFLLLLSLASLIAGILQATENFKRNKASFVLHTVLALPVGIAIIQTGSRTGVAVMAVLLILFAWKMSRWVSTILLAFCCIFLFYTGSLSNVIPRFESMSQSFETRQLIWKYSMQVWHTSPIFGVTPLGFQETYALFEKTGIAHAHNLLLSLFCEYGVLGGTAFLFLIVWYVHKAVKTLTLTLSQQHKKPGLFFFSLPILPLTGILDHPLASPQTALLAIILLAGWERETDDEARLSSPAFPTRRTNIAHIKQSGSRLKA